MLICKGNDTQELCSMHALRKSGEVKDIKFDHEFLTLRSQLLRPIDKGVYAVDYKKHALIVKWKFDVSTKESKYDFLYQTKTHLRCQKRLSKIVPRLLAAYYLELKGKARGVQIMERVPGITLAEFLRSKRSPQQLEEAAENLKVMFDAIKAQRVWHGDLNSTNIVMDVRGDSVRRSYIIDFEEVVLDVDVGDNNFYSLLDDFIEDTNENWRQLIPYLRRAGLPLPHNYEDIEYEEHYGHLIRLKDKQVAKMTHDPLKLDTVVDSS